jgi:hypothetical protein
LAVAGGDDRYPKRAELISEMCGLRKAARRPPNAEHPTSLLDGDGWVRLDRLARRLARHLSFETRKGGREATASGDAPDKCRDDGLPIRMLCLIGGHLCPSQNSQPPVAILADLGEISQHCS